VVKKYNRQVIPFFKQLYFKLIQAYYISSSFVFFARTNIDHDSRLYISGSYGFNHQQALMNT